MIGRSGERGSGISVRAARHDDDDDDDDDNDDDRKDCAASVFVIISNLTDKIFLSNYLLIITKSPV